MRAMSTVLNCKSKKQVNKMKIKRLVSIYDYHNKNGGFNPNFDKEQKRKVIQFLEQFFKNKSDQHDPDCQPAAIVYHDHMAPILQNLSNTEEASGSVGVSGFVFKINRSRVYGLQSPIVADQVWRTTIRFYYHA